MTEFEMAYLVTDVQLAITANTSILFTMVSGFLLVSYVAAHRLSPLMITLLIGIYAYAFLGTAYTLERQMITGLNLTGEIAARAASGGEFHWHAAAEFGNSATSDTIRSSAPLVNLVISVVILLATLVFFFHCRRVNGNIGVPATPPSPQPVELRHRV